MTDIDKKELSEYVIKLQNGDGNAFEKIYNLTYRTARFTVLKIVKNEDDADDVLQESYVKMLEKINTLENPDSFMSWFNMMVANASKNFLRKEGKYILVDGKDEDGEDDEGGSKDYFESIADEGLFTPPDSGVEKDELQKIVMSFIDNLSDERREAILLYYYNEMTTKQIAESLGTNENTIKSRIFKAKQQLAEEIGAYQNKYGKLLGVAPMGLVKWALNYSSADIKDLPDFNTFFANTNISDLNSVSYTVEKTANSASNFFGNIVNKIQTLFGSNSDPKPIIATVVTVGVAVGGIAIGTGIAKNKDANKPENEKSTVSITEYAPIIETPTFDFNEEKEVDNEVEVKVLKYGVKGTFQAFSTEDGVVNTRPLLDRKNFSATYDELLEAVNENQKKYANETNEIVNYISSVRGVSVTNDTKLAEQAGVRAEEIAWSARDYSIRPDGTEYTTIFEYNGFDSGTRLECIAYRCESPEEAEKIFANDENLKKISNDSIQRIGVGVAMEPESEELVFVIHLYSTQESSSDLLSNLRDRLKFQRDSALDNTIDGMTDTISDLNELEKAVADIPVIGDILLYDFDTDKFEMRARQSLENILDRLENIGQ